MFKLLQSIHRKQLSLFFYAVIIAALIYSPFLLSVGMIGLAAIFTFQLDWTQVGWLRFNPNFFHYFAQFFRSKTHLIITLFFWIVFFSGIMTQDWGYWSNRLLMKLPFLVLPIIFCGLPKLSQRDYCGLLYFLVFALTVTCIGIGVNYGLHFEEINTLMQQGRPMPTPRNHIRFSLILALGIIASFFLYQVRFYLKYRWESKALLAATVFLFLMIHLLSVRSGLAALYLAIFVSAFRYVWLTGRYGVGLAVGIGLLLIPITAYYAIPSFQAKVAYVRYEFWIRENNLSGNYSDLWRLISLQMGIEIGNEHPIVGVGAGNLRQVVIDRYAAEYPEMKQIRMPHNQLISVYAGTGLVGLGVFLFAFFYPLVSRKSGSRKSRSRESGSREVGSPKSGVDSGPLEAQNRSHKSSATSGASLTPHSPSTQGLQTYDSQTYNSSTYNSKTYDLQTYNLFLAFHVIVFASFMVENTIENSIGVGFYAFFLLLSLQYNPQPQGE